jgi:hypothetical protein
MIFFLYVQKLNVQHLIKISLKISTKKINTNKLQERIQADFYHITRPYPNYKSVNNDRICKLNL